jgi:hypothetical protein
LVTRWSGAIRKERRFMRRSAVLSFCDTSRKILLGGGSDEEEEEEEGGGRAGVRREWWSRLSI